MNRVRFVGDKVLQYDERENSAEYALVDVVSKTTRRNALRGLYAVLEAF